MTNDGRHGIDGSARVANDPARFLELPLTFRSIDPAPPDLTALRANYAFIAAMFVFFVASAVAAYRENPDPSVRPRLRVVMLGVVIGSMLSFTTYLDNALGSGRIPMQLGMILAAFFFARQGGGSGGTPAITVDQRKIDYGYVKFGETRSFTVQVTNTGDGALRFQEQPYIEVVEGC